MDLRLEVAEFQDEARWRWRLVDAAGNFLADHAVELDRSAAEYEGFVDPYRFVRWHADPGRSEDSEAALVARLGEWIGAEVLGDVGVKLGERARSAPVVVRVEVPAAAEALLFRPLELGFVDGRPLAHWDVSLVFDLGAGPAPVEHPKSPTGSRLRLLALFSMPTDHAALNVRHERHELRRLVHRVALTAGGAIELRVLQYGVTRERLRDVVGERGGWDAIHFSGHGLPAGLVLERSDGTADVVATPELVDMLWPTREQLKLVTLSSCESAAATAAQTMRLLGLPQPRGEQRMTEDEGRSLPAVAHGLAAQLGCAAVAMRYPVEDEFAIALAAHLYGGLLRDRQPLARALQVAIQRTTGPGSASATSPLSVATPALFGAAAAALSLDLPPGAPEGFDLSTPGLAYFDPEPPRFVGRVGALARATAALDVESDRRAVLFHGMAGAGKTACSLELAYRHRERRFEAMVWHRAPLEGHDIDGALADFAISLERQLDGIEVTPYVLDRERLEHFLPRLSRLLADRSVLVVLDNVESLLTPEGAWRDPSWGVLVNALLAHDGLSRVVLTSRHVPETLRGDARVLIEQVNALSATESVLLARQLPNLGALIQGGGSLGPQAGRELVRDVLETVQGSPKLIELADYEAADSDALRERLREASAVWQRGGGRLEAFFATGEPDREYGVEDFLRVLEAWTLGAAARLPEHARTAFHVLCALESADRQQTVVRYAWSGIWRRLVGADDPPDVGAALELAAAGGLVEILRGTSETPDVYQIHPAIEEAGRRAAPAELQTAVDEELGELWLRLYRHGVAEESDRQTGPVIVKAGLAAAPYLLRIGEGDQAGVMLENVIKRDESARILAVALPLLRRVAEQTDDRATVLAIRATLLDVRARSHPAEALPAMRELLDEAEADEEFGIASGIAGMLINLLWAAGRLEQALEVVDRKVSLSHRGGLGEWEQLADDSVRLQLLQATGREELTLREMPTLLTRMDELTAAGADPGSIVPWNLREAVLVSATAAATELERFETALELNAAVQESQQLRGASPLERADAAFNAHGALLRLGRLDDAEQLLRHCRDVFEQEQSLVGLSVVYSAWADLEDERGHQEQAVRFEQRSLRLKYAVADLRNVIVSHHNLAGYLARDGRDRASVRAHRLAAAVISYRTTAGTLLDYVRPLARHLRDEPDLPIPSLAEVCELVLCEDEVDLAALLASLPELRPDEEEPFEAVIRMAREFPLDELMEVQRHLNAWMPVIALAIRAIEEDATARSELEATLGQIGRHDDWRELVARIRRIVAGERDESSLCEGLDVIDTAVVVRLLRGLSGRAPAR